MKALSVRTSLTLVYTGLLALVVTAVSLGYHSLLVRQLDRDATADLEGIVRGLHGYVQIRDGQPELVYDEHDPDATAFMDEATRFYQVYDGATGRLLAQSRGFESAGVDYTAAEVTAFISARGVHDVLTDRGRVRISSTVLTAGPGEEYLLQVGLPLDRIDRSIASLERLMMWGIGLGIGASALVGRWMAGRALAPLSRLAEATQSVDIDTLTRRLPVRGSGDELDRVTLAFNQALARVEQSVGDMRQFSAALAHELRTPLAILRGETELALTTPGLPDRVHQRLADQLEEFDRLNALISHILTLARAEAGQITLTRDPVDLTALVESTVEQIEPVAAAKGVVLTCRASAGVVVTGDAGWLRRLLLILLDNAVKFTPDGGRIRVDVSREHAFANLAVTDTGVGVPAEALPHIFERFFRADPSRSHHTEGAGLGLTLAKWIADRHHATVDVTSRAGQGATFTLRLPALAVTTPAEVHA